MTSIFTVELRVLPPDPCKASARWWWSRHGELSARNTRPNAASHPGVSGAYGGSSCARRVRGKTSCLYGPACGLWRR